MRKQGIFKIILFSILSLIILFIGIQIYFIIKHKGNVAILVTFESPIQTPMDINVLIDDKILIQKTVEQNSYFMITGNSLFIKPGKHVITVESKKRMITKEYNVVVCFFKYVMISYYPPLLDEDERFEIYENNRPLRLE